MGYRVHKVADRFKVVEVVDGEVRDITIRDTEKEAKTLSGLLNTGGGFDGWTPNFFLNRLQRSV